MSNNEYVLVHCTQASRSGAAKYVNELFGAVGRLRDESLLVCPADNEYIPTLSKSNFLTFSGLTGKGKVSKLLSMASQFVEMGRLLLGICGKKRSLVHFNFPGVYIFSLPLFLVLRRKKIKIVFTVHDVFPHRWLFPRWARTFELYVIKKLYFSADCLVVHHYAQRLTLENEIGLPRSVIKIVHHGVFPLNGAPLIRNSTEKIVALCFGAIRANKGYHLAIEAVQRLRSLGHPIELVIAGAASTGEADYWSSCRGLIEEKPDGIRVFEGYISESEIPEIFASASVVFLPYSDFHSQSGVATMALSSGRAIVSTSAGGLSEFLEREEFGIKIEDATVESVVQSLERALLLGDATLLAMGRSAYEIFLEKYSWTKAAQMHNEIYDELLSYSVN